MQGGQMDGSRANHFILHPTKEAMANLKSKMDRAIFNTNIMVIYRKVQLHVGPFSSSRSKVQHFVKMT